MTNWEKYREEIIDFCEQNFIYAFIDNLRNFVREKLQVKSLSYIELIDWLTQEAESKETSKEFIEQMQKCSMCNGVIDGCCKSAEPQQSKARFVRCHEKDGDEHIIDIRCIDEIGYNIEECATELVLYDYGRYFIRKPIDEVIQQLRIEVV